MALQQEENERVQPSSADLAPPTTQEEYERAARQEQRLQREDSSVSSWYLDFGIDLILVHELIILTVMI